MTFDEKAVTFECGGDTLVGVLAVPKAPAPRGVLFVVGGPQYRTGSHRQLLLLARELAADGVPVLRFDNRGMGDSEGAVRTFEEIDDDLSVAIDVMFEHVPALRDVVVWGLCGAASAALLYAHGDSRVSGLFLANPWVRTSDGMARTMVKRYYLPRLLDRSVWRRLVRGDLKLRRSLAELGSNVVRALHRRDAADLLEAFPDRMADGLARFDGKAMIYLSGNDFTAREFEEMCSTSPAWKRALARSEIEWRRLPDANHTFSTRDWRDQVTRWTREWMSSW
jgi:exosortase A-associated hydrolase 1